MKRSGKTAPSRHTGTLSHIPGSWREARSCQSAVSQWTEVVTTPMPHLSKAQAAVLALWSVGMGFARSCALTAVSFCLAQGLERKTNTVRQQVRECGYEAEAKRGGPRQEVKVETCFAPLLAWVLSWWAGKQLAWAVEATRVGQRCVVLVISVGYRGCAMPVAWTVLPATEKPAWRGEWLRLLRQVRTVVPRRCFVIGLADRGVYARWLFQRLVRLGWPPGLRLNTGGTGRPAQRVPSHPLRELVPQPGTQGGGQARPFRGRAAASRVRCWPAGLRATLLRGYCSPIWRRARATRGGRECGPGLTRALKSLSVGAGNGSAPACPIRSEPRGCGWPLPLPPYGCSVSGGGQRRRFPRVRSGRWRSTPYPPCAHGRPPNSASRGGFAAAGSPFSWPCAISGASREVALNLSPGRASLKNTH